MSINHTSKCDDCNSKNHTDAWQEIGETVHFDGGKAGTTDYAFFQCTKCGSAWVKVRDSGGLGGHGTFYHSLTERFF